MKKLILALCLLPSLASAQQQRNNPEPMLRSMIAAMGQDGAQIAAERDQCTMQASGLKMQLDAVQAELKALKETRAEPPKP